MRLIKQSYKIENHTPDMEKTIEMAGRVCYKSEDRATGPEATEKFVKRIIDSQHTSVLEHGTVTVRFVTDRAVTHELVRHRIASFSQVSQRYVDYSKDKHGGGLTFIEPVWGMTDSDRDTWTIFLKRIEYAYLDFRKHGWSPQQARAVLPNATATEIVVTANVREWRHIIKLRTSKAAHPQIRELMKPMAVEFAERWPILFGDLQHG